MLEKITTESSKLCFPCFLLVGWLVGFCFFFVF
ncbi:unnamed protein product [Nyctereutes procyonoides]|uniref:(raccoon dog) hypothetical protein n=1 Tax=Nyctereutes procyonoides TaxID=34880 RepID=A0A811YF54_NYCPR|nr:unnamed protein product [Nyctereutes procyonoides]